MNRNAMAWLLGLFVVLGLPASAAAREGWFIDYAAGPNVHIETESLEANHPYGAKSDSETWFLQQLNYGYSWRGPISLGLGLELDNFIDVEFKPYLKWSFLEEGPTEPYALLALHGGINDVSMIAGSLGFGVDHFITDHFYLLGEVRAGPHLVSDVPERDAEGDRRFRLRIDAAVSFGIGFSFGSDGSDGASDEE